MEERLALPLGLGRVEAETVPPRAGLGVGEVEAQALGLGGPGLALGAREGEGRAEAEAVRVAEAGSSRVVALGPSVSSRLGEMPRVTGPPCPASRARAVPPLLLSWAVAAQVPPGGAPGWGEKRYRAAPTPHSPEPEARLTVSTAAPTVFSPPTSPSRPNARECRAVRFAGGARLTTRGATELGVYSRRTPPTG